VALMERSIDAERTVEEGGRTFYEGTWAGQDVVLVLSRVGKVSAAITTMLLLKRFGVSHVIFTGVAGAVDPRLRIGDVVVAESSIQHDMDASPLFPRFEIPLLGKTEFKAALHGEALKAAADYLTGPFHSEVPLARRQAFGITQPQVHRGLIVSGDQFIADPARTTALRAVLPSALCTEMEGAAVAQVCHEMGDIPHAIIRVISDQADHGAAVDFLKFVNDVAEHMTGGIARQLLESFGKSRALR